LPAHAPDVPVVLHAPAPLQPNVVRVLPEHEVLQSVVEPGNTHAPAPLQPVAPQVPPMGLHAAVQQLPEPATPQTLLVHWSFPVHAPPLPRSVVHVPPGAQK